MELARPKPFHPAPWARGPHAQTILSHLWKTPCAELLWKPERLNLEDGEALHLETLEGSTNTVVVYFHGLGGHANSSYVQRSAALAAARGHGVISVNHRGAGQGRGLAQKPYHCGSTADVAAAVAHARQRFPGKRVVAVGYSLSAAMLVLLLGRDKHLCLPDAALLVNPPGDMEACSQRLLLGLNRLYDRRFVRLLRNHVEGRPGATALPSTPNLRVFDEVYTAPAAGFEDRDYYARCSCGSYLSSIQTPAVILTSEDDPFAPASDLGAPSPDVHLHTERHGGHCGYLAAEPTPLGTRRWMDYALDHYLAQLTGAITLPST
jgi:predicted alpha/beta-fold hydrolase